MPTEPTTDAGTSGPTGGQPGNEIHRDIADLPRRIEQFQHRLGPVPGLVAGLALRRYTSFQIGGPADLFLDPPSIDALAAALAAASELGVPVTCLGGGTNILVSDEGVRGLVVRLGKAFEYIRWDEGDERGATCDVGAATRFIRLAKDSVSRGMQGLEFAAGIPGSVGGAVQMNAGAFGGEVSQTLVSLTLVDACGNIHEKPRESLHFSYRKLALDRGVVITSARFRLLRSSVGRLQQVVARVQEKRRRNQPAGYPNAGSMFKNPPGEYAGRLIEKAGLKGTIQGGAQVSDAHANFIVNLGTATARDVRDLMSLVQEDVWKRCGVWLEPEVRLVGQWDEARTRRP